MFESTVILTEKPNATSPAPLTPALADLNANQNILDEGSHVQECMQVPVLGGQSFYLKPLCENNTVQLRVYADMLCSVPTAIVNASTCIAHAGFQGRVLKLVCKPNVITRPIFPRLTMAPGDFDFLTIAKTVNDLATLAVQVDYWPTSTANRTGRLLQRNGAPLLLPGQTCQTFKCSGTGQLANISGFESVRDYLLPREGYPMNNATDMPVTVPLYAVTNWTTMLQVDAYGDSECAALVNSSSYFGLPADDFTSLPLSVTLTGTDGSVTTVSCPSPEAGTAGYYDEMSITGFAYHEDTTCVMWFSDCRRQSHPSWPGNAPCYVNPLWVENCETCRNAGYFTYTMTIVTCLVQIPLVYLSFVRQGPYLTLTLTLN